MIFWNEDILEKPRHSETPYDQKFVKIALTAVVLLSAFGGLLWYSLQQDTAYYKHVDEVMVSPDQWKGKSLQLHGFVVKGTWVQKPNTLRVSVQGREQGQRRPRVVHRHPAGHVQG